MSEVTVIGWFDQDSKTLWEFKPKSIVTNAVSVVLKSDYDAAQSELAALREELAMWKGRTTNVCMKLTAAEQRNAALETLIHRALFAEVTDGYVDRFTAMKELKALLKPTESGASE